MKNLHLIEIKRRDLVTLKIFLNETCLKIPLLKFCTDFLYIVYLVLFCFNGK